MLKLNLPLLRQLAQHLDARGIRALSWDGQDFGLKIAMHPPRGADLPAPPPLPAAAQPGVLPSPAVERMLEAPWIGRFAAAHPARAMPPAEAGLHVRRDDVLGLIRTAGGILRAVRSPWTGTIVERFAEDGMRVEFGSPLFRVRVDAMEAG